MLKAILFSFALPKIMSLYIAEILLLSSIIRRSIRSVFSKSEPVKLVVFNSLSERSFASIVVFEICVKLGLLLLSSIALGVLEAEKIAYEIKMFLYFYIFLLMPSNYLGRLIGQYIGAITVIHFAISILIISYSVTQYSFQSLLWRSNEFGGRFVGFTGSSIGIDGFTLIGSTANSIGVLYLLLLVYFQNNNSHYLLRAICVFGILLSFSQTAFLGLVGYALVSFLSNLGKLTYWLGFICLVAVFTLIQNALDFSVIDRVFHTIEAIITTGKLPATLLDRYLQISNVAQVITSCPGALFLGEFYFKLSPCPETFIVESYFFEKLQSFGFAGFSLAIIKFFLFVYILNKRCSVNLNYFYVYWFVSNLLLANTFETDFILLTIISIIAYQRERKINEI